MLVTYGVIENIPGNDISYYKIKKVNGCWNIEGLTLDKKLINFTFDQTYIPAVRPNVAVLRRSKTNNLVLTWFNNICNDKASYEFTHFKNDVNDTSPPIAGFLIEENLEVHCVAFSDNVIVENNNEIDVVVEQRKNSYLINDMIDTHFVNFINWKINYKSKLNLLDKISLTDSVAALEAQVDLLSLLIFQLAELIPEENRPVWLAQLKTIVTNYGVQHTHSVDKMLTDINQNKSLLTELRNIYINERQ